MYKRIVWLDIAKYIGILFVIISHLESCTSILRNLFLPCFLTIFLFCSGYVFRVSDTFGIMLSKKVRGLFIPWLFWSVINILLAQVVQFNGRDLVSELGWNFLQIRGHGDRIWFVAALFVANIPFYFFVKWYESVNARGNTKILTGFVLIAGLLSLCSSLYVEFGNPMWFPWQSVRLPWHLEYIFYAIFFMFLGYLFKTRGEKIFDCYNNKVFCISCCIIYLLLVYVPVILCVELSGTVGIMYEYVCSIVGIVWVVSLCKHVRGNRYMLYIGQNTLLCFAMHGKVYAVVEGIFHRFGIAIYSVVLESNLYSTLFAIVFALVITLILIIPIWIVNRYIPAVAGRKRN